MVDLVADIGATNARFRLSEAQTWRSDVVSFPTADFHAAADLLHTALTALDCRPDRAVLAVAGPPDDAGDITVTNGGLQFFAAQCQQLLGGPVLLVNDFYAQAAAVPVCQSLVQIGQAVGQSIDEDPAATGDVRALLGPGSGLGMATIIRLTGDRWHILAGEGGHADLAPGNHLEAELWSALVGELGHVSWESVLSGPGLKNLYRAMCATWGMPAEDLSAAQISALGQDMSNLVCHQTLETFCSLLGAAAGNLALTVGAKGGVYIGGGIVPRMPEFAQSSPLRRRFDDKGEMADYVKAIPLYLITEAQPGLLGARRALLASALGGR